MAGVALIVYIFGESCVDSKGLGVPNINENYNQHVTEYINPDEQNENG